MGTIEPYHDDAPLHEESRFHQDHYEIILSSNEDKSKGYIAVVARAKQLEAHHIAWRRAVDYFRLHAKVNLPQDNLEFVGEIIDKIFAEQSFGKRYLLIEGIPSCKGAEGRLEWLVDHSPTGAIEQDSNGRMNFYKVDNIVNVKVEDHLAKVHPPEEGKPGIDIFGEVIPPPKTRAMQYKAGNGVRLDEDSLTFIAEMDGGLSFLSSTISVEPVYYVSKDVDFSVGNIEFRGQVRIQGQVLDGFTVQADKDIFIDGTVGASTLDAGGQVILGSGMAGKERGKILSKGNVQAKYLNSSSVESAGNVEIQGEIVNSKVNALGSVIVPEGRIFNSEVTANEDIICDILGSNLGVRTKASAGLNYLNRRKIHEVDEQINKLNVTFDKIKDKIEPLITDETVFKSLPLEKVDIINRLKDEMNKIKEEVVTMAQNREYLATTLENNTRYSITVYGRVYPGVEIQIADCRKNIETELIGPIQFTVDPVKRIVELRSITLNNG